MDIVQFNRLLRQMLLVPVLALACLAGAMYYMLKAANDTVALIQTSDQRIVRMNLIERLIVDEETGLRGYEVTGDPRFLEPYHQAERSLQTIFQSFSNGPVIDPRQRRAALELRTQYRNWHDGFAEPIIAKVGARSVPLQIESEEQGKEQMDAIRAQIGGILQRSEERRLGRVALWHKQIRLIVVALFALAILIGLAIGIFVRERMRSLSNAYDGSLRTSKQKMEETFRSEQQLRTTLTSIGDGVISCDSAGKVILLNTMAEHLTGWQSTEAAGRDVTEVFRIVNEETRSPVESPVAKVRRLNRVVGLANHTILIRKDESELHIADSGAPIRAEDGSLHGVVMVFRDITPEKKMQEALLANEKLVTAGRLAASIAHEVHNPLDLIANLLYLLQTSTSGEESKQFIDLAQKEVARVIEISRAMLGLYRESAAAISIDLSSLLHELLVLMEGSFADLGVSVSSELPRGILIKGFPGELRQVFTNLIMNAAQATGNNGKVSVSISERRSGTTVRSGLSGSVDVTIADDGPGIPETVLPKLFQPFFTTKGTNGTGLGLWVSRGIILKHGGTLHLTSSTDPATRGTIARVSLPAA